MDQFFRPLQRRRYHEQEHGTATSSSLPPGITSSTSTGSTHNNNGPDKTLATQLNSLSLQERQNVLEEIHGVLSAVEETTQLVEESLTQMRRELDRRKIEYLEKLNQKQNRKRKQNQNQNEPLFRQGGDNNQAGSEQDKNTNRNDYGVQCYIRALDIDQQMKERGPPVDRRTLISLDDRAFLVKFLRAERFHVVKASVRLLNYLVEKEKLFGSDKLLKVIQLSDLDDDTMNTLRSGYFQILPGRDVAGRAIMCAFGKLRSFEHDKNFLEMIYFLSMFIVEDITTQRNGVVCLGYSVGTPRRLGREILRKVGELTDGLPMRIASYHYCLDDQALRTIANALALAIGNNCGVRYRFHAGTDLEVAYQLMTFGIPQRVLPVSVTGEIDVSRHRAFIHDLERLEAEQMTNFKTQMGSSRVSSKSEETNQEVIIVPGPRDVLLGRGRLIQENMGNIRYRNLIESYRDQYDIARKKEKTRLTVEIVQKVNNDGGRFLKQFNEDGEGTTWVEVSTNVAREKVSHSFRDKRRVE